MSANICKLRGFGWAALSVALTLGAAHPAAVRAGDEEFLNNAMAKVFVAANSLENQSAFGYDVGGEVCMLGAFIAPGESVTLRRQFRVGTRYAILAGGDRDARDIDIEIIDPRGNRVVQDMATDNCPAVTFTAHSPDYHDIRVHLYSASESSFVFVATLREGGYHVPKEDQIAAGADLVLRWQQLAESRDAKFLTTPGNWAVYGSILAGGEETAIDNINFGIGSRVVLTGSDDDARDLDLFVQTNKSDEVLLADERPDSYPHVVGRFTGGLQRIRVRNAESGSDPTFVLTGILTLP